MDVLAILFSVLRSIGWKINLDENWDIDPNIVATANHETRSMQVNAGVDRYDQLFSVIGIAFGLANFPHSWGIYRIAYAGDYLRVNEDHRNQIDYQIGIFIAILEAVKSEQKESGYGAH